MLSNQETPQNYQESAHYQLVYHGTHPIFVLPSTIDTSSDASATPNDDEKCLIGGQFSDITLVFKDGQMDVNSCLLAAISSNFHSSLQDESTMVLLPDLSYSSFLKFLKFLFEPGESTQLVDDNIRETVAYLGCKLLQPVPDFYQYLSTTASYNNASSHSNLNAASNYDQSQSINQKSNGISESQQIRVENAQKVEHDHVAPLSPQPNSPSPERERVKKKCKRKRKDVIIRDFAEMELDAETLSRLNQELTKGQHTYSHQFPNQLFCHICSETGFSSVAAIIEHIKTVHCWTHSLDHCVFCDIPFMSTPAAIKHEKNKCKNTTYSCYICGCSQGKRQDLIQHLLESHMRGIQRKCPHCSLDFLVLSTLSSSTWSHPDNCESRKASQQKSKEKNEKSVCRQKCVKCGALHSDIWKHRRNCIAMNTDIKFVCHCCSQGFRRMGSLTKHFTINVKCKKNAKNELEYQGVLKSLENPVKGLTTCADCGLRYATKRGRQTHARNCSAFTRFKCNACNKGMNALDGFHIHFSKYPACRSAKENKEIVAELMARSAKPDFHVCHLCGAQYKTKETIDKHMLTHAETVNYFYCNQPECGKSFLTLKSLDLHLKNHTMPMVICSICGKQVKQGSLGLHMVLHTGKKVTCPVCGKLFQHRGVLNKHFTACHTEKRRRKRRAAPQEGNELSYLVPYMQTIQVNMGSEGEDPHSRHIDHQHQEQQQPNQQQQQLQQHQQHAVLNNSSILIVKILVNSSGQIVVEEGSSQHQALVIPNHHQQQGMLTNTTAANDHHQQLTIQNVQGSMYVPHSNNPILSVPLPPNYNKNNAGTTSTIDMNPIIQTTSSNSKQQ